MVGLETGVAASEKGVVALEKGVGLEQVVLDLRGRLLHQRVTLGATHKMEL